VEDQTSSIPRLDVPNSKRRDVDRDSAQLIRLTVFITLQFPSYLIEISIQRLPTSPQQPAQSTITPVLGSKAQTSKRKKAGRRGRAKLPATAWLSVSLV